MVALICDKIGLCTLLSLLFHYKKTVTIATKIGEATPTMTSGENALYTHTRELWARNPLLAIVYSILVPRHVICN